MSPSVTLRFLVLFAILFLAGVIALQHYIVTTTQTYHAERRAETAFRTEVTDPAVTTTVTTTVPAADETATNTTQQVNTARPLSATTASLPTSAEEPLPAVTEQTIELTINGITLTPAQVQSLENTLGVPLTAGDYWYDSVRGLYGLMGQATSGLGPAQLSYGVLAANASAGDSDVFVNGRQLRQAEKTLLAFTLGTIIPGRYWFYANGDYGIEGSTSPLGNLYNVTGGGQTGDNFWQSGHYGAGNYTSDGSQGYVSVPGYGPVSHGM